MRMPLLVLGSARVEELLRLDAGLLERHARFEAPDRVKAAVVLPDVAVFLAGRHPERRARLAALEREPAREDADDLVRLVVEPYDGAHDVASRAKSRLPRLVAEHGHAWSADDVLAWQERAAEDRANAEHLEQSGADARAGDLLRRGGAGEHRAEPGPDGNAGVRRLLLTPHDEVGVVQRHAIPARGEHCLLLSQRIRLPDGDEASRVVVGQRPEQDAVDDAEDRGPGADRERDGRDGDCGKRGAPAERSEGKPEVEQQGFHASSVGVDRLDNAAARLVGSNVRF